MVQGKFKKAKLPASLQKKQKEKNAKAFTRRSTAISKTVNKSVENELRSRAVEGQIKLSKAQEAVAKHHQAKAAEAGPSTSTS
ncbi:unnamed protein product [Ceratitis capitata]|uniref:(Mediterranean fruit fly) hypothetical protein n=1 Tax=Ceratitis capitata TaxID=7213 RepID=A0A811V6J9_CERCA|nr:unnamed protein product [Ceratitis capitata]